MKLMKILAGLLSLILTFVAVSFLVGPFISSISGSELNITQRFAFAGIGVIVFGMAALLWLWSTKESDTLK